MGLHLDPKYFPDPNKYDPERFSDDNKSNIVKGAYLPFGEGLRKCIGNCNAKNVYKYFQQLLHILIVSLLITIKSNFKNIYLAKFTMTNKQNKLL